MRISTLKGGEASADRDDVAGCNDINEMPSASIHLRSGVDSRAETVAAVFHLKEWQQSAGQAESHLQYIQIFSCASNRRISQWFGMSDCARAGKVGVRKNCSKDQTESTMFAAMAGVRSRNLGLGLGLGWTVLLSLSELWGRQKL